LARNALLYVEFLREPSRNSALSYRDVLWDPNLTQRSVVYRRLVGTKLQISVLYRDVLCELIAHSALLYTDVLWEPSGTERPVVHRYPVGT